MSDGAPLPEPGMDDGLSADELVAQEMRGLPDDLKAAYGEQVKNDSLHEGIRRGRQAKRGSV